MDSACTIASPHDLCCEQRLTVDSKIDISPFAKSRLPGVLNLTADHLHMIHIHQPDSAWLNMPHTNP
jgi:hypothetical protein